MDAVGDRHIAGAGTTESAWAAADWLREARALQLRELLPDGARLVVVSPHPDDEVLGCGGLLHDAMAAGHALRVVALTDGEQAYPDEAAWPPERLGPARRRELSAALSALGASQADLCHLGFGDGRLAGQHDALVRALLPLCGPDDVLLVTWGRDGHPDHECAARAVREVAARRRLPWIEYPIWGWHWADATQSPFGSGLRRYALGNAARAAKAAAMDCFATQTGRVDPPPAAPILPPAVLARFQRDFEIYLCP